MLENLHPPCSHKKRTFDGQKIPSWLREHREGGKVEDKGGGGGR